MDVHLRGFDGLVAEPEGDDGAIDAVLEKLHRRTMAQHMRCDAFPLSQSRSPLAVSYRIGLARSLRSLPMHRTCAPARSTISPQDRRKAGASRSAKRATHIDRNGDWVDDGTT
jgi:hypothetical protein